MGRRETALKTLRDLVMQAAWNQDRSRLLTPGAGRAARDLAEVIDPEHDIKAAWVLGMFHWLRYEALPVGDDHEEFAAAARFLAGVYREDPDVVPRSLHDWYEGRPGALAADANRRGLGLITAYRRGGEPSLLGEAAALLRAAADTVPAGDPGRAGYLSDLGAALRLLSECTGDSGELAAAIDVHRDAVAAAEGQPDRPGCLYNLAAALMTSYERTGNSGHLDESAALFRAALDAAPADGPDRAAMLSGLAAAMAKMSERTADTVLLADAAEIHRAAVAATPAWHADRARRLSNLGGALQAMSEGSADTGLLAEAATAHRAALDASLAGDPDHVGYLSNLAVALARLSERTGDTGPLSEAVGIFRDVLAAVPAHDPHRGGYLSNFTAAAVRLAERTGSTGLLAEAVEASRLATETMPTGHPDLAWYLSNLGVALQKMFERTGDTTVLAEAAGTYRAAVAAAPGTLPGRATCLSNLGLILRMQFEVTGDTSTLAEAAGIHRAAVAAAAPGEPGRAGYLSNLGATLSSLAERTGNNELLAEAVGAYRAAVEATVTGDPARAGILSNLGLALQAMAELAGNTGLLAEAVKTHRAAVDAAPGDHPDRAGNLSNLGVALQVQSGWTADAGLLEEATSYFRAAVDITPADDPGRAAYLSNLGNALQLLAARAPDAGVLAEAARCYGEAAASTGAPALARIWACRQLARIADRRGRHQDALIAMEAAVGLLPQIAPRTLLRPDREHRLGQLAGLAGDAAAAAIGAGRPERAVELLEQTRGILVADTVQGRSGDVALLRQAAPALADAFEQARDQLDALGSHAPAVHGAELTGGPGGHPGHRAMAQAAGSLAGARRQAHEAWEKLVGRIRDSGFPDFLRVPGIDKLAAQASGGPVIFISTSPARCAALILTPGPSAPVRVVPLGITETQVYEQANRFAGARAEATDPGAGDEARMRAQAAILDVLAWMWDAITGPVLAALGHDCAPAGGRDWPRVWWCPVGVLAYLPLHAAGHHRDRMAGDPALGGNPRTVLDRVISSYAPTVQGMAYARTHQPDTTARTTLIVAVPDAPGTLPLPGVAEEAEQLARLIPGARVLASPTHDRVLAALAGSDTAHLACHGHADMSDPAASQLILPDHADKPLTISEIGALRLNASLAFLSACDTLVSRPELADEAVHITGAFHLAGYRHVIGTLWQISDTAAQKLALDVYTCLTGNGAHPPDTSLAATALHHATRNLRARYPAFPTQWAAHTHTGP